MPRKPTGRKPGRPPRPEETSQPYSIRMDAKLRQALQRAADDNSRSLRAEIESRLRDSLEESKRHSSLEERFGGPKNYALVLLFGDVLKHIEDRASSPVPFFDRAKALRWFSDPFVAGQVRSGISALLDIWGAKGEPKPRPENLSDYDRDRADQLGANIAEMFSNQVLWADLEQPIDSESVSYSVGLKRYSFIKRAWLGIGPLKRSK